MDTSDDRVGNLTIVVNDNTTIAGIKSQVLTLCNILEKQCLIFTVIFKIGFATKQTSVQATLCSVGNYSNPPAHGALIVYKVGVDYFMIARCFMKESNSLLLFQILTTPELREEWLESLKVCAGSS